MAKKKSLGGSAPKSIIALKNRDKKGHEHWDDKRVKDIGNFPSPARILLLGPCGVGKSTLIKNLIMHARPKFQEVFVIHEDAEFTKEYDDLEPTQMLSDVPPIDFWEYDGPYIKRAVIVDDLELTSANKERMKNLAIMFRYASTHKGLTIYFAHQSFFDVMGLIKKMANVYIIWKPRAKTEIALIENRTGMEKGQLGQLFKQVATGHRDSICVDLTENSPAPLRKNIWDVIEVDDSDTDSSDSDSDSD
jgi:GTPase SAR1 family protein